MAEVKETPAVLPAKSWSGGPATVLDRSDEGLAVMEKLIAIDGQVAVLHGRERCGKTEFVRTWVIPALPKDLPTYYGACAPELPNVVEGIAGPVSLNDALRGKGFVFLDSFERFLDTPVALRRHAVIPLFSDRTATLVLMTSDRSLRDLLGLRSIEPGIMEHLIETGEMSLAEGLKHIIAPADGPTLNYGSELLHAIEADLETFSPARRVLTPELILLIDSYFRRVARFDQGNVEIRHFEHVGGLRGVLEADLEQKLSIAPAEMKAAGGVLLHGILEEFVASSSARRDFDVLEPARRLGLDPELCKACLAWLKEQAIVREGRPGVLELSPAQLEQTIAEALEQKHRNTRAAREVLARGLASWTELHVVLPPESFAAVDSVRTDLFVADEEAAFLVQCAIRSTKSGETPAKYWLGRIRTREQKISAAFVGLFDVDPSVRVPAAALLADFVEPQVCAQLYRTAVEDPAANVRREAVNSLRGMEVTEYWEPLASDARLPSSRYREAAVEALRLFRDTRSVELLKELVSDDATPPEIRQKSIETMAEIDCPEAAETLVEIALYDKDDDDRANAADALASQSKEIARVALTALRQDRPSRLVRSGPLDAWRLALQTGALIPAVLIGALNLLFHGLALIVIKRVRTGLAIFAAEIIIVTAVLAGFAPTWLGWFNVATLLVGTLLPMKTLIERRCRGEMRLGTFAGLLSIVLYVVNGFTTFFLFHGLAHLLTGKVRAAVRIFGLQLIALGCLGLYFLDQQTYQLTKVGRFYLIVFVILWVFTWLWDVVLVVPENLLDPERAKVKRRSHEAYGRMVAKTTAATCLMEFAEGADDKNRDWAASVLRLCSDSVPPAWWVEVFRTRGAGTPSFVDRALRHARREDTIREIQALWKDSEPVTRGRIFRILARNPSESSLDYLWKMRNELSFLYTMRYYLAWLEFRARLMPRMLSIAIILALPMAVSLAVHGYEYVRKPSRLAMDFVSSEAARKKEPERVVKFAKFVTGAYPAEVEGTVVSGLGRILAGTDNQNPKASVNQFSIAGSPRLDGAPWEVRIEAGQVLSEMLQSQRPKISAPARAELRRNLKRLSDVLSSPDLQSRFDVENRKKILDILEAVATPPASELPEPAGSTASSEAVKALKNFAMLPNSDAKDRIPASPTIGPTAERAIIGSSSPRRSDLQGLQIEAVRTLGRIPSASASEALKELAEAATVTEIGKEAEAQTRHMASLLVETVRAAYGQGDYERAVENGSRVLKLLESNDSQKARDLLIILGQSKSRIAQTANANPKRADELNRAAATYLERASNIAPLDADSLRTLVACYLGIAERLDPKDPEAMAYVGKALAANPLSAEAYGTKGLILSNRNQPELALAALGEATRLEPRYAWAYCMQALINLNLGRSAAATEYAQKAISADPDYAWSFTLLGEAYHRQDKDREAISAFDGLRKRMPDNPWPLLAQMYIDHENLSAVDSSAYQNNYLLYKELEKAKYQAKITKPADLEAGFVEANLTTGRYDEAARRGTKLLEKMKEESDFRLSIPVRVIVYLALALKGDYSKALNELNECETAVKNLPKTYKLEWTFKGTVRFILASKAPEPLKTRLAELVQAVEKDAAHVSPNVFEANREALKKGR